ncbi:MAG: DUF2781 domain-containing protein [Kocuria palustris]|nr:DUF2781 domain-containing protein [Kocuria palustris]
MDTVPLLPSFLQTNLSHQLREFYITTYRDKFFEDPPTWFTVFIWMELLYHLPVSIWAARGLLKGTLLLSLKLMLVHRTWYYVYTMYILVSLSIQPSPTPNHLHLHHVLYPLYPLHIYIKCNIWKSDYISLSSPNRGMASQK